MTFESVEGVMTITCDAIFTLALASILLLIGYWVKKKISFLEKYCIPAPVVGGFLFMFVTFIGHMTNSFAFKFDAYFQSPFMLAFFTTVGLGASFSLLKRGGVLLVIYWLVTGIISILQNVIGIAVSKVVGLCGHGLGATPSAIVNMTAVTEEYGMSRRAFMIVPIVGAFLVDIIYQPQTIAFIKLFVQGFTD